MRGAAILVSGAALAFLLTSGAFLLLANLGSNPSERTLAPAASGPEPFLTLTFGKSQLESLQQAPDQRLAPVVRNGREEPISDVNITLEVSSENTALSEVRHYRATVEKLDPGESISVPFEIDLSPLGQSPDRMILEVQATTPEGLSAVRTAILPF